MTAMMAAIHGDAPESSRIRYICNTYATNPKLEAEWLERELDEHFGLVHLRHEQQLPQRSAFA